MDHWHMHLILSAKLRKITSRAEQQNCTQTSQMTYIIQIAIAFRLSYRASNSLTRVGKLNFQSADRFYLEQKPSKKTNSFYYIVHTKRHE